jgi:hypothetical protein
MAAGVTDHRWAFRELLTAKLSPEILDEHRLPQSWPKMMRSLHMLSLAA